MTKQLRRVLRMIEHGTITAAEGERLLEAMEKSQTIPDSGVNQERFLHIEVKKAGDFGKINVPLMAAQAFLKAWEYQHHTLVEFCETLEVNANDLLRFIETGYVGEVTTLTAREAKVRIWIDRIKD